MYKYIYIFLFFNFLTHRKLFHLMLNQSELQPNELKKVFILFQTLLILIFKILSDIFLLSILANVLQLSKSKLILLSAMMSRQITFFHHHFLFLIFLSQFKSVLMKNIMFNACNKLASTILMN